MQAYLRYFLGLLSFAFLILALLASIVTYGSFIYLAKGPLEDTKVIIIEKGLGLNQIAHLLEKEGVISDALVFRISARLLGRHDSLKAGEYEFAMHDSISSVQSKIHDGKIYGRKFTVPEGYTSYQVVKLLNTNETLSGAITKVPEEGTLLPETYHYQSSDSKSSQIQQMQEAMKDVVAELWPKRSPDLPFSTQEEAVILASIVEKETGVSSERKKVAGVFVNRLKRGIPLQTDPTVIYALTMGKVQDSGKGPLGRRLLRKDLSVDSPYNTYKYKGLPPGPIANPGKASIEAALHPEKHDYVYFVADGTGGHSFAKTLKEHNQNVAKWRKIRAAQK